VPVSIKVINYVHSSSRWVEWFHYCLAYLNAAEILLRQLTAKPNQEQPWHMPSAVPAIYCLRHSVELLLKFMACAVGQPLQKTHNPEKLFAAIREPLSNIDESQLENAASVLGQEASFLRQFLDAGTKDVEAVVNKYHSYSFLKEPGRIKDNQNEVFRYPVTLADGAVFSPEQIHETLDVSQALADVATLQRFIWCLVFTFGITEDGDHRGPAP
jgi:hypothetical protein